MKKAVLLFSIILLSFSLFSQAKQGADKMYYDEKGNLFSGITYEYFHDTVVRAEIEIVNGQPDGLTRIYFEQGNLEEIRSFKAGKMHGKWEKWNANQVKVAEANYAENLKDGKWFIWDDQGVLRYDMTYDKGKKSGTWLMYDEKGQLTDQKTY